MSDFLRKNKTYIIVIGLLVIYLIVFRLVSLAINKENSKYANIVVDGINIWEYNESNWRVVSEDEFKEKEQIFDLYSSSEYYGDYTVKVNNKKLYAFDDKYKSLQYDDTVLAINSNYDIDVYFFEYSEVLEQDNNILAGFINSDYVSKIKKITLDVNANEVEECFYVVDYYDSTDVLFTEIYYYDGKLKEIIKNNGSMYSVYDIDYILDINDDDKYELIVSSSYFNVVSYKIYKLDGKNYKLFLE